MQPPQTQLPDLPLPPEELSTADMGLRPRAVQAWGLQPWLVQGRLQCGLATFPRESPV